MDEDLKNRTFDKYIFKTPKIKTRNLCLRKTKSFYNNSKFSTSKTGVLKRSSGFVIQNMETPIWRWYYRIAEYY